MKNYHYLLIFLCGLIICSCQNAIKSEVAEGKKELDSVDILNEELGVPTDSIELEFSDYEKSKLRFFISSFLKKNPESFNNDVSMEHYSNELRKSLDYIIAKDSAFILDLPVSYDELVTDGASDIKTKEKMYIVGFKSGLFGEGFISSDKFDYRIEYTIIGGIKKSEMMKLKQGEQYYISGKIQSRVDDDYSGRKFAISDGNIYLGTFFIKDLAFKKAFD